MKIYLLDTGWLEGDANWIVAMSVVGTRGNPHPTARWIRIPVYAVLIDHPQGKILYDTGCAPETFNKPEDIFPFYHDENQTLVRQLALAHTNPEEIKTVILSHLHFDHAGNIGLFPQAEMYVHKNELEQNQVGNFSVKVDLSSFAKRYYLVEKDREIAPKVKLITLPGHSPGVLGMMVELENHGRLIFPSDAIYSRENFGPPARLSGIVYDSLSFLESIEKVRRLAKEYDAKVIFPHDMELFKTLRKAPDCYD